ncbi:MAG: sigma-54-dependent Fis family transcriptional regulator [Candidatus Latescibacteria bacterium]|nr:sigma-54-dependent Fis family transcriptional regulator [Candidatus Latescibacterota bacterium]
MSEEQAKILLVDDQPANLEVLCDLLESKGYNVLLAPSGQMALKSAARAAPDLILLDVMMPEMDGYETCRRLKEAEETRQIPVIFITARDLKEDVVQGFQAGGVDYITKPFQEEEVLVRVQTHVRLNRLARELETRNEELAGKNEALEREIAQRQALKGQLSSLSQREAERWGLEGFVGQSPTIEKIFREIRLLQESAGTSVLISGESGTGKELIARALHFGSARREGPFVPVNCAAIPAALVESALFGHAKGSFTGASADQAGYFEMADGGALFLDEIGDMPLELQAKLLRVLEDGQVWRVGAREGKKVEVRVLAATNVDLQQQIREGGFRQDLYFRLAHYTVEVPPLRERQEDVPLLARHFLTFFAGEMGREAPELSHAALERLKGYSFPGNVRELKNIIERALIESHGEQIQPQHLHFVAGKGTAPGLASPSPSLPELPLDLDLAARQAELQVVRRAMEQCGGNLSEVARLLGTSRNRIYRVLGEEKPPG